MIKAVGKSAFPAPQIRVHLTRSLAGATGRDLVVQRLQRGARGGDQQLGSLIATGELDAVIFFADPSVPHGGDVDFHALTRLAIMHDTPIALSPSAADMVVAASLGARDS